MVLNISDDHKRLTFDNGIVISIRENKDLYDLIVFHMNRPDHYGTHGKYKSEEAAVNALERIWVNMLEYRKTTGGNAND